MCCVSCSVFVELLLLKIHICSNPCESFAACMVLYNNVSVCVCVCVVTRCDGCVSCLRRVGVSTCDDMWWHHCDTRLDFLLWAREAPQTFLSSSLVLTGGCTSCSCISSDDCLRPLVSPQLLWGRWSSSWDTSSAPASCTAPCCGPR